MRRLFLIMIAFVLMLSCFGVSAMDLEKNVGEVLYHQNFSDISQISESSLLIGTASSPNSSASNAMTAI